MAMPTSIVLLALAVSPPPGAPSGAEATKPRPQSAAQAERAAIAAMKRLASQGLAKDAAPDARRGAIAAIEALSGEADLRAAVEILGGAGDRRDWVHADPEVRKALFTALARDESYGRRALVEFAVTGDDPVRLAAIDLLPRALGDEAEARIRGFLSGSRELHINRAAMIASAYGSASLIPSLVSAQFAPDVERRGDEAWIVIGKQTTYVRDLIPTVGDGSAAFQPVPGTVFEGSLLRIMESSVTIYRTEVHYALAGLVERTTGEPPPPFGYDVARWRTWQERELPALLARKQQAERERELESRTKTTVPARDEG